MGGGSIRIHDPNQQQLVLEILNESIAEMVKYLHYCYCNVSDFSLIL